MRAALPAFDGSANAGKRTQRRLSEVEEILEILVWLGQVVG